jgi:hypothetical protein
MVKLQLQKYKMSRWTEEDDMNLVRAWKSKVSELGTESAPKNMWSAIADCVPNRDVQACKNRWCRIQLLVQLWAEARKKAAALQPDGEQEEDEEQVKKAYELLVQSYNLGKAKPQQFSTRFKLGHCYELMKDCPRFGGMEKVGGLAPGEGEDQEIGEGEIGESEVGEDEIGVEVIMPKVEGARRSAAKRKRDEERDSVDLEYRMAKLNHFKNMERIAIALEESNKLKFFSSPYCPQELSARFFAQEAQKYLNSGMEN